MPKLKTLEATFQYSSIFQYINDNKIYCKDIKNKGKQNSINIKKPKINIAN